MWKLAEEKPAITAEEFSKWLSPPDALAFLSHMDWRTARQAIVARAVNGLLRAGAEIATTRYRGQEKRHEFFNIDRVIWKRGGNQFYAPTFWSSGDLELEIRDDETSPVYSQKIAIALFTVRFDRDGLQKMRHSTVSDPVRPPTSSNPPAPVVQPNKVSHKGGRPKKEWWDECWIAIFGQIYRGDLKPKNQAAIESAMADWAVSHGYDASEQSFRARARLLWAMMKEDKN